MGGSALLLLVLFAAPDFDAIVTGVGNRAHAESCAQMKGWVAEHGPDPRARRGLCWCARLLLSDGELGQARPIVEGLLAQRADDEAAMQALSTLGEINFAQGRRAEAAENFRTLAASPVELWRYSGTQALIEVQRAQRAWLQAYLAGALLMLWLAVRGASIRRDLWPVPAEVLVLVPLFVLLAGVAFTQPALIGRSLVALVLGGTVVAWLNGAYWRARPPLGNRKFLEALKGGAQSLLLLDLVLVGSGLWRPLLQSMVEGFE